MVATDDFELIECVSAEALARHPVWCHWNPELDRERVLGWGVPARVVDRQVEQFEACGPIPLYPLLELDELEDRKDLIVAARFEAADGARLGGYLLDPLAFGIFHGGREYSLNRSLPAFSEREAEQLAAELGTTPDTIFPLFFRLDERVPVGTDPTGASEGEIERFW